MELNDIITLAAASLLSGSVKNGVVIGPTPQVNAPTQDEISTAVKTARRIWHETLRQERNHED